MNTKWYHKTWVTILLLTSFAPVGIYHMCKFRDWKKPVKIVWAALSIVNLIAGILMLKNPWWDELADFEDDLEDDEFDIEVDLVEIDFDEAD